MNFQRKYLLQYSAIASVVAIVCLLIAAAPSLSPGAPVATNSPSQRAQVAAASAVAETVPIGPPLDANGWTVFTPSPGTGSCVAGTYTGTCVTYVSSSLGNDATCAPVMYGAATSTPCATITKAITKMRHGAPDWVLLKKGDVWNVAPADLRAMTLINIGRSPTEPALISSYGTGARPLIKTGCFAGVSIYGATYNAIAIVGLEFYPDAHDPSSPTFTGCEPSGYTAISTAQRFDYLLIEDDKMSFYSGGMAFTGAFAPLSQNNLIMRRNIIVDAWSMTGRPQGIFIGGVGGQFVIQDNLFDHNGWNEKVPQLPTVLNHNVYIDQDAGNVVNGQFSGALTAPVTFTGNIDADASANGAQFREGGTITDNLFLHNPIAFNFADTSTVDGNVILEGSDVMTSPVVTPRGGGIEAGNSHAADLNANSGPQSITNNIIAHKVSVATFGSGIELDPVNCNPSLGYCTHREQNVLVDHNIICGWDNPIVDYGINDIFTNNTISTSTCNGLGFPDPNRSVATYDTLLGGPGTEADFIARERLQSKDNWNPALTASAVNNYIRAGFGIGTYTPPIPTPSPTPTPTSSPTPTPTTPSTPTTPTTPSQSPTTPSIGYIVPGMHDISMPTNLSAYSGTSSQMMLTWLPSYAPNVSGYTIYRGSIKLGTVDANTLTYTDTGLNSGSTYEYGVSAYDSAGNTSQQVSANATTIGGPSAPGTGTGAVGARYVFAHGLSIGSTGIDVTALQNLLMQKGLLVVPGGPTGYYGGLTAKAVQALQAQNNLEQVGYVGPKTRALLNSM